MGNIENPDFINDEQPATAVVENPAENRLDETSKIPEHELSTNETVVDPIRAASVENLRPKNVGNDRSQKIIGGVLAALAVSSVGIGLISNKDKKPQPAGANDNDRNAAMNNDLKEALTVKTTTVDCIDTAKQSGIAEVYNRGTDKKPVWGVKFDVGAVKPVGENENQRRWSDALSTPLKSVEADKQAQLEEIQASICEDPELGATVANLFANMEVGSVKVVDLNPWLKPFAGSAENINDRASEFIPLLDANSPSEKDITAAITKNSEYEVLAEKLNTMLTRFNNLGKGEGMTVLNYHLTAGGLVVGVLPEVGLNPTQYKAKAIRFLLTQKTGECLIEIGFNVGDKRPVTFENCVETTPTTIKRKTTRTTIARRNTTTTVRTYGPKQNPRPPVSGGASTTVPAPESGPSYPTTSTTEAPQPTPEPEDPTPTTAPTTQPPRP